MIKRYRIDITAYMRIEVNATSQEQALELVHEWDKQDGDGIDIREFILDEEDQWEIEEYEPSDDEIAKGNTVYDAMSLRTMALPVEVLARE